MLTANKTLQKKPDSRQKGSILVGLIITMVLMAVLGSAMVYLTGTSVFHQAFANSHIRAYYAAESGGNYALSRVREAYASSNALGLAVLNNMINQTYTLTDGSRFQITNYSSDGGNPETVTFSAIGLVKSGFVTAKREIIYKIQPADQGGVIPPPPTQPNVDLQILAESAIGVGDFEYKDPIDGGAALQETGLKGGGNAAEAYLGFPSNMASPFYTSWVNAGQFLSYDTQVKVASGGVNGSGNFVNGTGPLDYMLGNLFRYVVGGGAGNKDCLLGVSFVRTTDAKPKDAIPDTMVPTPTSSYNNVPMISLWERGSNHASGDETYLAYKVLDTTSNVITTNATDPICPAGVQCVKKWSTIATRVVEAASIKLSGSVGPAVGTIISGGSGTARVIKNIRDVDGNIVVLLNNVTTGFSMPASISGSNTSSWRSKDIYVWAFYGDTADHTPADANPKNQYRLLNQRGGPLNWMPTDISAWSASDDHFTLVQWDNTNQGAGYTCASYTSTQCLYLMGGTSSDNEYKSIVRYDSPYAITNSTYNAAKNPELGVSAIGSDIAGKGYFTDMGYYMPNGTTIYDGSGTVIQSP